MLIKDLKKYLKENYEGDIKRQLRDALIALKIQGQERVSTLAVLKDFATRGIQISISELINLLEDDPMIEDVNRNEIVFRSDIPNPNPDTEHKQETDEELKFNVKRMAKKALRKRFGKSRR